MSKSLQNKLYRKAKRLCYRAIKSRARFWRWENQLEWMLVTLDTNCVILGSRFDASIEEIQEFLDGEEQS